MRMPFVATTALALACGLGSGPAEAVMTFKATLTGSQEVPPVPDEGSGGMEIFALNEAPTRLT